LEQVEREIEASRHERNEGHDDFENGRWYCSYCRYVSYNIKRDKQNLKIEYLKKWITCIPRSLEMGKLLELNLQG